MKVAVALMKARVRVFVSSQLRSFATTLMGFQRSVSANPQTSEVFYLGMPVYKPNVAYAIDIRLLYLYSQYTVYIPAPSSIYNLIPTNSPTDRRELSNSYDGQSPKSDCTVCRSKP